MRASAALAPLGACRCVRPEAPRLSGSSRSVGLVPSPGPGAASTALARPVTRARSRIIRIGSSRSPGPEPYRPAPLGACHFVRPEASRLSGSSRLVGPGAALLWLVPSPGPGAASTALARPVARARSRISSIGSSRSPGPEPYRLASLGACRCVRPEASRLSGSSRSVGPRAALLWLVPSPGPGAASTALARPVTRARSRISCTGSSRSPGPEPYRLASLSACRCVRPEASRLSGSSRLVGPGAVPLWLVPSPGPGAASTALARPVTRARSHIGRTGSSRSPGPEPYR